MKRRKRTNRFDMGMRGWILTTARDNLWRVAAWYDLDDLIQEGYICYAICAKKYPHVEQKHFMALLKTCFNNRIHDLASAKARSIVAVEPIEGADECKFNYYYAHDSENDILFNVLLQQLPAELKQLVKTLLNDGKDIPMQRTANGSRETTNSYLCRLLGLDSKVDLVTVFKEHFGVT